MLSSLPSRVTWLLPRFLRAQRATVAVLFAFSMVPVLGLVGLAADGARAYMVKSRLSQAVDSAALAGGKAISESYRDEEITKYFDGNYPQGYLDSTLQPLQIVANESEGTVEVIATAEVPTTFLQVLKIDSITVGARALVNQETRGMELVLVMDNTGSMRSGGKIDAMKQAATSLINILYGQDETMENFWVGLVPYAATVNIGSQRTGWLQNYDPADFQPTTWKGCVEARAEPFDSDDSLPAAQSWDPHLWASTFGVYPGETGDNDWGPIDESNGAQNDGTGPNLGCGPAITSLIDTKTTILAKIDEMLPWHRGGTMANLGLAWGWRVMSPAWRGLWGGSTPATLPLDYDTPKIDKVVVLLTDGANQWYDWPGGLPGSPDSSTFPDADYTAYGRLSEGRLGTTNKSAAKTEINSRMAGLCTSMKAQNITIYTVVFQVNDSATQDLYRNCASTQDKYFQSPTNEDLQVVFQKIATELSYLRLAE